MIHFEGEKDFAQTPVDLWAKLSDARFLVQCIPDVDSVAQMEADTAKVIIRPGFSFVRGTLEVTLGVAEALAPTSVRVVANSKGIGSSSEVEAALALTPVENGTRIQWTTDVKQLGGLLTAVPHGLIKAAAQKVIGDVWAMVEARVGTSSP